MNSDPEYWAKMEKAWMSAKLIENNEQFLMEANNLMMLDHELPGKAFFDYAAELKRRKEVRDGLSS
jgi:hypothetical protein